MTDEADKPRRGRPPMDDVKKHVASLEAGVRGRLEKEFDGYAFSGGTAGDQALYQQRALAYQQRQYQRMRSGDWGADGDLLHLAYRAAASQPGDGRAFVLQELAIAAIEAAVREERSNG